MQIMFSLLSVHSFSVSVLPGTKLESGAATLHLCNNVLVIAKDLPAVIIGHWNLLDLRRYGPVNNGFVFEGGTRCGYCECANIIMKRLIIFSLFIKCSFKVWLVIMVFCFVTCKV